jgi:hypothetical protein
VAYVGRLDAQKGVHLIHHAIFRSLRKGAQFVLLGSSPEPGINAHFWRLKHHLNDNPDCHLEISYDEELAHLIYAGADILVGRRTEAGVFTNGRWTILVETFEGTHPARASAPNQIRIGASWSRSPPSTPRDTRWCICPSPQYQRRSR